MKESDLLATNAATRAERERIRGTELVGAVLLVQPALGQELVGVLEVPLAMRSTPHRDGDGRLVAIVNILQPLWLAMGYTYTSWNEVAVHGVAALGNSPDEADGGAGEDPQTFINDSRHVSAFAQGLKVDLVIGRESGADLFYEFIQHTTVAEQVIEET